MKKYLGLLMALVLSLNVGACTDTASKKDSSSTAPQKELNIERGNVVQMVATVEKIDLKKRLVTIRGPEGNVMTVRAGKEVVNLPQVHVGDKVVLDYIQSLAVRMAKPGEIRDERIQMIDTAPLGSKPEVVETTETTVTATILALDKGNKTATLKRPDGEVVVVKVQDPANLEKVKVGETLVITYIEAVALSVQ